MIDLCDGHLELLSEAGELEVYVNCPCGSAAAKGGRLCAKHAAKVLDAGLSVPARGRIPGAVLSAIGVTPGPSKVDAAVEGAAKRSARTELATTPTPPRKLPAKPVRPAIVSAMTAKAREGLVLAEGVDPAPGPAKVVEAPASSTTATIEPQRPTVPDEPAPVDVLLPDLSESERDELIRLRQQSAFLMEANAVLREIRDLLDWARGSWTSEPIDPPDPKTGTGRELLARLNGYRWAVDTVNVLQPDIKQVGTLPLDTLRERLATFLAKSWTADLERDLKINRDALEEVIWVLNNVDANGSIPDHQATQDSAQRLKTVYSHPEHHPARRVLEIIVQRAKAVIAGRAVHVPTPLNGAPTIAVVLPSTGSGEPTIHVTGSKRQIKMALDALNSTLLLTF